TSFEILDELVGSLGRAIADNQRSVLLWFLIYNRLKRIPDISFLVSCCGDQNIIFVRHSCLLLKIAIDVIPDDGSDSQGKLPPGCLQDWMGRIDRAHSNL